jgi:hypothetical protein
MWTVPQEPMGNRNKTTSSRRHVQLSERDGLRVFNLVEKPPAPNAELLAAALALPERQSLQKPGTPSVNYNP